MDKLLEFIDRLCLDEKLYWRVPYVGRDGSAEIVWRRDAKPHSWSVREAGASDYSSVPKAELPATLKRLGLDIKAFERQAGASILTQAVFADMVLEGAVTLFGAEAVEHSIKDTRSFLTGVSDKAARMSRASSKLRLV